MYSFDGTVKEIYCKLEKLGKFPECENDVKYEKKLKKDLEELCKGNYITKEQFEELINKCDEAMLADEVKGFLTGVYFILKMQKDMGNDFINIVKRFGMGM